MSTYYSVYADNDEEELPEEIVKLTFDEDEVLMTIDVKDIPEGTKKLTFKVW